MKKVTVGNHGEMQSAQGTAIVFMMNAIKQHPTVEGALGALIYSLDHKSPSPTLRMFCQYDFSLPRDDALLRADVGEKHLLAMSHATQALFAALGGSKSDVFLPITPAASWCVHVETQPVGDKHICVVAVCTTNAEVSEKLVDIGIKSLFSSAKRILGLLEVP